MKSLGIVDAPQNSTACLVEDGEVLACVAEERLCRIKKCGGFPRLAVTEVLSSTGTEPEEVDTVRAGFSGLDMASRLVFDTLNMPPAPIIGRPLEQFVVAGFEAYRWSVLNSPLRFVDTSASNRLFARKVRSMGLKNATIEHENHHLAHAAAGHYTSGFDRSVAIIIDAYGDGASGGVFSCMERDIEHLSRFPVSASLGYFYGCVTELLGLRFGFDEGKTMALAAYGKPMDYGTLHNLFEVDGIELSGDGTRLRRLSSLSYARALGEGKKRDLACSAQTVVEEVVCELVQNAVEATGLHKVVLSGGLFLNVKLNGLVSQLDGVEDVFVPPDPGDGGCAMGAALLAFAGSGRLRRDRMEHPYLGPEAERPSAAELERTFGGKVTVTEHADITGLVGSELLPAGKLVGVYWGRMEYGPRALGNRSVLADPTNPDSPDQIRATIKKRPPYQPFCQTVLESAAEDYIINPKGLNAPFMTLALPATERSKEETPAVVHVDGTCRPQVLAKGVNQPYYHLIEAFARETGVPVVLNTSFNRSGEAIVHTADHVITNLLEGGLDAVVIGDVLVERV